MTQDILDLIMLSGAPLLESIRCDASRFSQNLPIPLRMLHHCPRLESFQWHSVRSPLLLPLVDTPLTSVSLDTALSVSDCMALLRFSPRLSSAKFHSLYDHNSPSTPHLTHSTLRTLTAAGGHCTTLLDALTLPSLVDLDLIIGETRPPLPIRWEVALPAFLGRNNSMLRQLSLSIAHPGGGESTLLRILALVPRLYSLKLTEGPQIPCRSATRLSAHCTLRLPQAPPCVRTSRGCSSPEWRNAPMGCAPRCSAPGEARRPMRIRLRVWSGCKSNSRMACVTVTKRR
ncbi:hypothetical protein BD779DRAFT_1144653 [Infundibulicybe gibba]|nr:hypothetical protein BD779DRAFT_1144653 [Infundibulicybe gibba]